MDVVVTKVRNTVATASIDVCTVILSFAGYMPFMRGSECSLLINMVRVSTCTMVAVKIKSTICSMVLIFTDATSADNVLCSDHKPSYTRGGRTGSKGHQSIGR